MTDIGPWCDKDNKEIYWKCVSWSIQRWTTAYPSVTCLGISTGVSGTGTFVPVPASAVPAVSWPGSRGIIGYQRISCATCDLTNFPVDVPTSITTKILQCARNHSHLWQVVLVPVYIPVYIPAKIPRNGTGGKRLTLDSHRPITWAKY